MAFSPTQNEADFEKLADQIEKQIDSRQNEYDGRPIFMLHHIEFPEKLASYDAQQKMIDLLKPRYRKAGWKDFDISYSYKSITLYRDYTKAEMTKAYYD